MRSRNASADSLVIIAEKVLSPSPVYALRAMPRMACCVSASSACACSSCAAASCAAACCAFSVSRASLNSSVTTSSSCALAATRAAASAAVCGSSADDGSAGTSTPRTAARTMTASRSGRREARWGPAVRGCARGAPWCGGAPFRPWGSATGNATVRKPAGSTRPAGVSPSSVTQRPLGHTHRKGRYRPVTMRET